MRRRSRFPSPLLAALALIGAVAIAACGSTTSPTPSTSLPVPSPSATSAISPDPPATEPGPSGEPSASPVVGQTETEFGMIWDGLPAGFPQYPGSQPTDTGDGPVSGQFSVPADVATVTPYMQAALEGAGYSTFAQSGPFEDGSMTIESVGPESLDCRVLTTIAPAGDGTLVTVLFGAACPLG
jgi:hypothetical protein